MKTRKESVKKRCGRIIKKAWYRIVGLLAKAAKLVRIKYKEHTQRKREKAFGIRYRDLVQRDTSDQQLQECVNKSKAEIAVIKQEIVKLKIAVDRIDEKTQMKIKKSRRQVKKCEKHAAHSKTEPKNYSKEKKADRQPMHRPQREYATAHVKNYTASPAFVKCEEYEAHSKMKPKNSSKEKKGDKQPMHRPQREYATAHVETPPYSPEFVGISHHVSPSAPLEEDL
jgi:hypothetical protein